MSSSIGAARACATTLLFHSLRLHAFRGAVPHVILVADQVPCVQQKVLLDGYVSVLQSYNDSPANRASFVAPSAAREASETHDTRPLLLSLHPSAETPCGSDGFAHPYCDAATAASAEEEAERQRQSPSSPRLPPLSYTVLPFAKDNFMQTVKQLQQFLRHCGDGSSSTAVAPDAPSLASLPQKKWSEEDFQAAFQELRPFLHLLHFGPAAAATTADAEETLVKQPPSAAVSPSPIRCSVGDEESGRNTKDTGDDDDDAALCKALFCGPPRELLGCILIQKNAFQNELKQYRLRLELFDRGIRVAEHGHLLIMSAAADALAKEGDYKAAVAEEQVCLYSRSCAYQPEVALLVAKAIADAIDLYSWSRGAPTGETNSGGAAGAAVAENETTGEVGHGPPASWRAALEHPELSRLFPPGSLQWRGVPNHYDCSRKERDASSHSAATPAALATTDVEAVLKRPIVGPGLPLRIRCRDAAKTLVYSGGMEDCLTNTGYYGAAYTAERNAVAAHRNRFPVEELPVATRVAATAGVADGGSALQGLDRPSLDATTSSARMADGASVHGRLKKKEYLAMLKAKGQKPNKRRPDSDEEDEHEGASSQHRQAATASTAAGSAISQSIGGTFPVGEVISESFDLSKLNGTCDVFAYPDVFKKVTISQPKPFSLEIRGGIVEAVGDGAPAEFLDLLSLVRQVEGACYVRELGIGLNPFVGRGRVVHDVTTFERQWGIHLSLGQRHPLFVKQKACRNGDGSIAAGVAIEGPVLKRKAGKYHIDVFLDAAELRMGDVFSVDFSRDIMVSS